MQDAVRQVVSNILERFRTGDIPRAIALSMFPVPDIPAAKWSLLNRTLMMLAGTYDARGYMQWQKVGRKVKKGAKSFHILVPCIRKIEADDEDQYTIKGFLVMPVFRVEDTQGEPLHYEKIEYPELPLTEVAKSWGIELRTVPGNDVCLGSFKESTQEIVLASKEEVVFFHELAHAAHSRIKGGLEQGQNWRQEIVAELSASALCQMIGKEDKYLGGSYAYIEHYAWQAKLSPYRACTQIINEVEQVLDMIIGASSTSCWEKKTV